MSEAEVQEFLAEERTLICASNGRDGWPHLMPLWYVVRDGTLWAWTFARSQKVVNLRRDDRVTVQVEAGEDYDKLRGVMLECRAAVHEDRETVAVLGMEIMSRYSGGADLGEEGRALIARQAEKRVAIEFREQRRSTWDHRKLGAGVY